MPNGILLCPLAYTNPSFFECKDQIEKRGVSERKFLRVSMRMIDVPSAFDRERSEGDHSDIPVSHAGRRIWGLVIAPYHFQGLDIRRRSR